MGARIAVNGAVLGNATDEWMRYVYALNVSELRPTKNLLEVSFGAELGIETGGRFTVSDQIDWAPVMPTRDLSNHRATFGFGIGRSVYLVPLQARGVALMHFVPHTFYAGGHPIEILSGEKTSLFAPFIYKMHYFTKTGSGQT